MEKKNTEQAKTKYWTGILYPESTPNWESEIANKLQVPFEYCLHDNCFIKETGELRKPHVHVVYVFSNTTTYKHALKVFQRLSPTTNYVEEVIDISYIHDYLIHDTDDCRKEGKTLYPKENRISGNNFDIGSYVQISKIEKQEFKKEVIQIIKDHNFVEFFQLMDYIYSNYDSAKIEIFDSYQSQFNNYMRSIRHYKKEKAEKELNERVPTPCEAMGIGTLNPLPKAKEEE